ncbi:hypothetical protein [Stappia indica]|uniref:Uncharacterized protein n=1 Tax=Stappia indica TaxID=538381 RepID=A0A285TYX1_9HYPH|nr:hypothetical protein [Stappia indica]SOC27660.1 hypothetical protein SAMN05421512_12015 [Stappia indica]
MEGFYALYYTGVAGFGHAVLVMRQGIISGADATGGVYDGTYSTVDDTTEAAVKLTVPAGATLVTGQTLSEPLTQNISATLNSSFADGHPVAIRTPMGPVNVIFKKLRNLT